MAGRAEIECRNEEWDRNTKSEDEQALPGLLVSDEVATRSLEELNGCTALLAPNNRLHNTTRHADENDEEEGRTNAVGLGIDSDGTLATKIDSEK